MSQVATRESVSVQEAAVAYGKLGFRVFPLHWMENDRCSCGDPECVGNSRGKHPLHVGWQEEATTDEATIRRLWTENPKANVGIVTGNGLLVIDIDPRDGGDESLMDLESQYGRLPETALVLTGSGGRHFYLIGDCASKNPDQDLYPGVHVKANGGFVVAPPSVHHSGRSYTWEASSVLGEVALALVPQWFLSLLPHDAGVAIMSTRERLDVDSILAGVKEGERHTKLIQLAGKYRGDGRTKRESVVLIKDAMNHATPPYDEETAEDIVRSAWESWETNAERRKKDVTEPPKPLVLRSLTELRQQGVEPTAFLISGVLPRGGLLQVLAAPKVAKSILLLNLALDIVRGDDFLGRPTLKGPVLFLSAEGGLELLYERLGTMAPQDGADLDHLFLWTPQRGELRLRLDDPIHRLMLADACVERGVVALIVDPLYLFHDLNENDSRDMKGLAQGLIGLGQETQAGIIIAHHNRKTGPSSRSGSAEEGRGSSVLHGAVDASLVLNRRADSVIATYELRWSESPPPLSLTLDADTLTFSVAGEVHHGERKLDSDRLLAIFNKADAPLGYDGLMTRTGCSRNTVKDVVKRLLADGLIGEATEGRRKVWTIVEEADRAPF